MSGALSLLPLPWLDRARACSTVNGCGGIRRRPHVRATSAATACPSARLRGARRPMARASGRKVTCASRFCKGLLVLNKNDCPRRAVRRAPARGGVLAASAAAAAGFALLGGQHGRNGNERHRVVEPSRSDVGSAGSSNGSTHEHTQTKKYRGKPRAKGGVDGEVDVGCAPCDIQYNSIVGRYDGHWMHGVR